FHATTDAQAVRDRVYAEMLSHRFKVQATICEKAKAQPQVTSSKARFYKYPWFYHFKHGIADHVAADVRLLVTVASVGNKKERATFCNALDDVVSQTMKRGQWKVDFRPAQADPCLQFLNA
ncbi:MAG TPA: hypothetical protein VLB84_06085, partial [Bacteroidia bacterium]|nr:hypothetical protein [Bacteroidia bacterium]